MLKRTMAVVMVLALALTAGSAVAQTCTVGVYADAAGTQNFFTPTQGEAFSIHMVAFVEDFVNAVGPYELIVPNLVTPENPTGDVIALGNFFGPSNSGIAIDDDGTQGGLYNAGLGECAIGFNAVPIVVETYTLFFPFHPQDQRIVSIVGTPDYSTCQGVTNSCAVVSDLLLDSVISTTSESWGAVKSLYGN